MPEAGPPLFSGAAWRCTELAPEGIPRLQRFFEANPEYFVTVNGEPPGADTGREEYDSLPPAGWPYDRKWVLAFEDAEGEMIAMAGGIAGLFAPQVWHLGIFIVATSHWGKGTAGELCNGLENWMLRSGARWSRLGVAECNPRAERFWRSRGYVELRKYDGLVMGRNTNTVRIMSKPLDGATWEEYMALVERDRPPQ